MLIFSFLLVDTWTVSGMMREMVDAHLIHFNEWDSTLASLRGCLTAAELQRAAQFRRSQDARAYIISHAQLRLLLARRLDCDATAVKIEIDQYGKPFLADTHQQTHFNMSHSGDYALIAMYDAGLVGVDIECLNVAMNFAALAQRFFAQEECAYILPKAGEEQRLAFFEVWTRKEAYVKALGRGLAYGLDRFSVVSSDLKLRAGVDEFQFESINAPNGYSGVACFQVPSYIS